MKAQNIKEAWQAAGAILGTDYIIDDTSSNRAGYSIYRSTQEDNNGYICDLGDRLEVNLQNGKSYNIWIQTTEEPKKENDIKNITNIINSMVELGMWKLDRVDIQYNIVGSFCAYVWLQNGKQYRLWNNGRIEDAGRG